MLEAVIAAVGILVCAIVGYWCFWFLGELGFSFPKDLKNGWLAALSGLFIAAAFFVLFFFVRFIHWAWETPTPFLDRFTS